MGTIAEKGAYTIETKSLLKQKINNLGGDITSQTTFRQYANQLQTIYDNLPKTEYQEGTEVNLGKTIKGKLDFDNGVVGIGQSSQDGTPTPSTPIEIEYVRGWNILNQDKLEYGTISQSDGTTISPSADVLYLDDYIPIKPSSNYTFRSNRAGYLVRLFYYDRNKNYISTETKSGTFTTISTAYYLRVQCGVVVNDEFQLVEGNENLPYLPYNTIEEVVSGKNLFEPVLSIDGTDIARNGVSSISVSNGEFTLVANATDIYFGQVVNSGVTYGNTRGVKIYRNGNEKISFRCTNNLFTKNLFTAFDINGVSLGATMLIGDTGTYTFPNGCEFVTFRFGYGSAVSGTTYKTKVILAYGDTIPPYEPYITPTSYQLSLGDKELYDECYIVGTPDNWKFVDNRKKVVFNGSEDWAYNFNQSMFRIPVADVKYAPGGSVVANIKSNYYQAQAYTPLYEKQVDYGIAPGTTGNDYIYIRNNGITSVADFKTWLGTHNTEVVYETRQPIETPITDTILISQLNAWYNAHSNNGTTIITSNGNLPMIIKVRGLKGE